MAVFRVDRTADYTVMSNTHFREKAMSLKAKGLLSLMLSLPDDWDYSIEGLVAICKESETAIKSTLNELKEFGYLEIIKLLPNQTGTGRIDYVYQIYERPQKQEGKKQGVENLGVEFLGVENQAVEIQAVENQGQLNTNILNTEKENTKQSNTDKQKEPKHRYGEYKHVLLTDTERTNLVEAFGEDVVHNAIKFLDEYIEEKGYKSKSHNLAIRRWVIDAVTKRNKVSNKPQTEQEYKDMWRNA